MTEPHDPLVSAPSNILLLWQRASESLEAADHSAARELLAQALAEASGAVSSDGQQAQDLEDRLFCGLTALDLELGNAISAEELRAILMRSASPTVLHLAAYQLARMFELRTEPKKALFYARLSLDHAERAAEDRLKARCQNLIGNALIASSYFEQAQAAYDAALQLDAEPNSIRHLALLQNVGYCHVVQGNQQQGLGLLYQVVRGLRYRGAEAYLPSALVDLAFGLLSAGRPHLALRHCERAVHLSDQQEQNTPGRDKSLANSLFLLAEAASQCGDEFATRRACARLSDVTGQPDLSEYVLHAEVLNLVNLRA